MTNKKHPAEERREGMTLERFAEVMAHRKFFPYNGEEVLLRLGIRPARWSRASRAWGDALAAAISGEEPEIALRFARAFGTTSRKLREFPPRLEELGDPIDPNVPDAEERAPVVEKPSFMLDDKPDEPVNSSGQPISTGSVWMQYAKTAPAAPPLPPSPARPPGLGETADISAFVPRNPLPFGGKPEGAVEPPEAAPAPADWKPGKR